MTVLRFLGRHWGKLLILLFALWFFGIFDPINEPIEFLGLNSPRMVGVQTSCHLAPFPLQRSRLRVKERSSMFSHVTTIYFKSTPEIVTRWMDDSPSIRAAKPFVPLGRSNAKAGTMAYILDPGIGFISADKTEVGVTLGGYIDGPADECPIPGPLNSWVPL